MASRARVGVALLAAVLAAGCAGSPSAPAAPVAATGVEATINDVPWSEVGPGWTLATWSPVTAKRPGEEVAAGEPSPEPAATTLFLVGPSGNRYAVTTLSGADARLRLRDWSGDGSRALFVSGEYPKPSKMISVDLRTGAQTRISVSGYPATSARTARHCWCRLTSWATSPRG
jgi:hypothetical protein